MAPMIGRPVRVLLESVYDNIIEKGREDLRNSYNTLIGTNLSTQSLQAARLCATWHHDANKSAAEKAISHGKHNKTGI